MDDKNEITSADTTYDDLLDIRHKQTPFFTKIEISGAHVEHIENSLLMESGERKNYTNIDIALMMLHFNASNLSILDTLRALLYLVAQKYPRDDFGRVLDDAIKRTSLKPENPTKAAETFEMLAKNHASGASNYLSLMSHFFKEKRAVLEQYLNREDFSTLETVFGSCGEIIDNSGDNERAASTKEAGKAVLLNDIDDETVSKIVELTPLGVIAAQDNLFVGISKPRADGIKNDTEAKKAPFLFYEKDTISLNRYGNERYIGYRPEIKSKIESEIAGGNFTAKATLVFYTKKKMIPDGK